MMTYEYLTALYSDLISMSTTLVVKRMDLARANETLATAKAFELYYACLKGDTYFFNFEMFNADILAKYMDAVEVAICLDDRNQIPVEYRASIVADQISYTIANYTECNEYYRMLMGLPALDDSQCIYLSGYESDGINPETPIHEMSDDCIARLDTLKVIDALIADNPTKHYLKYLGSNKIDFVVARLAKPFEIIRITTPTNNKSQDMFEREYYSSRRYVMTSLYNNQLFYDRPLYEPIMGVIILCMAMRNTLVPNEADYLNFDEVLNAILESYGLLAYFKKLPFTYKKRLVKALDNLYAKKGTDIVLIDLADIFAFDSMTVNRFYLLKTNKRDVDGRLIFSNDPDQQYDLNFVKSDIQADQIDMSDENWEDYETIVNNDPLWQLTDAEHTALMGEDFNLMMSKYINIEAAYDLSQLTMEVCFFVNLLLDSKDNLSKIQATNQYSTSGYSSAFTMLLFLLAALAKRAGYDGNILYTPASIAELYKFNLNVIQSTLQAVIDKYDVGSKINVSDILLTKPVGYESSSDMVTVYLKNRKIYDHIISEMATTTDYTYYCALADLKKILFVSCLTTNNFTKMDGTTATTYLDMLTDIDKELGDKIISTPVGDDLNNLLLYIMEKMEQLFNRPELRYLFINTPNTSGALISKFLKQAIEIFKASSVQLISINVFFHLGDGDPIRIFDQQWHHTNRFDNEDAKIYDTLATQQTIILEDPIATMDKGYTV